MRASLLLIILPFWASVSAGAEITAQQRIKTLVGFSNTMHLRGYMAKSNLLSLPLWNIESDDSGALYYQRQLKRLQANSVLFDDITAHRLRLSELKFAQLPKSRAEILVYPITEATWAHFLPISESANTRDEFAKVSVSANELFGSVQNDDDGKATHVAGLLDILGALDGAYTYRLPTLDEWKTLVLGLDEPCQVTRFLKGYEKEFLLRRAWFAENADSPKPVGTTSRICHSDQNPFGDIIGNVWEIVKDENRLYIVGGSFQTSANNVNLRSQQDFVDSLIQPIDKTQILRKDVSFRLVREAR